MAVRRKDWKESRGIYSAFLNREEMEEVIASHEESKDISQGNNNLYLFPTTVNSSGETSFRDQLGNERLEHPRFNPSAYNLGEVDGIASSSRQGLHQESVGYNASLQLNIQHQLPDALKELCTITQRVQAQISPVDSAHQLSDGIDSSVKQRKPQAYGRSDSADHTDNQLLFNQYSPNPRGQHQANSRSDSADHTANQLQFNQYSLNPSGQHQANSLCFSEAQNLPGTSGITTAPPDRTKENDGKINQPKSNKLIRYIQELRSITMENRQTLDRENNLQCLREQLPSYSQSQENEHSQNHSMETTGGSESSGYGEEQRNMSDEEHKLTSDSTSNEQKMILNESENACASQPIFDGNFATAEETRDSESSFEDDSPNNFSQGMMLQHAMSVLIRSRQTSCGSETKPMATTSHNHALDHSDSYGNFLHASGPIAPPSVPVPQFVGTAPLANPYELYAGALPLQGREQLLARAVAAARRNHKPRGPKTMTPDGLKGPGYYEKRKRNNIAAKKSRDARKMREQEVARRTNMMEICNHIYKEQLRGLFDEYKETVQALLERGIPNVHIITAEKYSEINKLCYSNPSFN